MPSDNNSIPSTFGAVDSPILNALSSLPSNASAVLAAVDAGRARSLISYPGTTIRSEKTVVDLGTLLAYSFHHWMASTNVLVAAAISVMFDSQLSPASIGTTDLRSYQLVRGAIIAEAARLQLQDNAGSVLNGDFATIANTYGISLDKLTALVSRVTDKMDAIFLSSQSNTLLAAISEPNVAEGLSAYLSIPDVPKTDIEKAIRTLSTVHGQLVAGIDLTTVYATLGAMTTTISCFQHLYDLVNMRIFYGLPVAPMSIASLVSLVSADGAASQDIFDSLPLIQRSTAADKGTYAGQYKFWELDAPALIDSVSMADVMQTISVIDELLFGLRASRVPFENYLRFQVNSSLGQFVPAVPVVGNDLLQSEAFAGIRAITAVYGAMSQSGSPFLSTLRNGISSYKVSDVTKPLIPTIVAMLETLVAISDVAPRVRSLLIDVLDSCDEISLRFRPADGNDPSPYAAFTLNEVLPSSARSSGFSQAGGDIDADVQDSGARAMALSQLSSSAGERPRLASSSGPSTHLLNRSVVKHWQEIHAASLQPLMSMPANPETVRALLDPNSIVSRPPCFPLRHDLMYFLATDSWYTTAFDEATGSSRISLNALPVPFIQDKSRVFASVSASAGFADANAGAMARSLFPAGVLHRTVPFFVVPGVTVGAFDLRGLLGMFPLSSLSRISGRSGDPIAQTIAGLVTLWGRDVVSLGLSRIQTAAYLRSASVLKTGSDADIIDQWSGLYRVANLPLQGQIEDTNDNVVSNTSELAFALAPEPVVMIKSRSPLRVERATTIGPNFSLDAPTLATHAFPHSTLSQVDAAILLDPSKKLENEISGDLAINHAPSGEYNYSMGERASNKDAILETNLGLRKQGTSTAPDTADDGPMTPDSNQADSLSSNIS